MTKILYFIYTVWHLATPFLVFFSFLDRTISGYVTEISDFLHYRNFKITDISEVVKFWKVLINFHKVMIVISFFAISLRPCLNIHKKTIKRKRRKKKRFI